MEVIERTQVDNEEEGEGVVCVHYLYLRFSRAASYVSPPLLL